MKKVLIVDDDIAILDALSLVLDEMGYLVAAVSKGEETYEKVRDFIPDIILLDLLISGVDGRDICKQLKENPSTKSIPIVMISAHPNAKKGALEAGAQDFLAKPFDTGELLAKVEAYSV